MLDVATSCACSDPSAWWFQPVGSCSSDVCLSLRSFAFLFHRIRRVHPRLFLLPPPTILRAPFPHAHRRRRGTHLSTTTGGSRPFRSFLDVFRVHSFPMGVFRDGTVRTFHPPVPTPRSDASRCAAHVAMAHNVVVVVVVAAVSKRSRTQPIQKPKKEEKIPSTNELKNEKKKRERKEGRIPRPYVKGRGRGTGRRRERWDGMRSSALVERDDATCAVGRCVSSRPLPSPRQTRKERCARTQGQEGRRAWTRSIEKERCDVPTVRGNRGVPRPRHALESFHAPTTRANGREVWRTHATWTVGWTDLASHLPLSRCRRGISSPTLSSDLVPLRVMRHFPGRLSPGSTLGFSSDGTGTCTLSSFLDRPSISHPFFRSNRSRFDRTIRSFSSVAWSLSKGER